MKISNLIGISESTTVEWKPSLSQVNEIIETICAFTNTEGGKVFIGVSKTGKLLGVQIGKGTIENLTNQISQHTDPKIHPRIDTKKIDDKEIIVIDIKESSEHLVLAFGRPYKRVGKSTVKMSKDEYERLIIEKHKEKLYFDSRIFKDATLKDTDEGKIKWFIKEAKNQRGFKLSEGLSIKEILTKLKLIKDKKLTHACLLLFSKEPIFLQSEVKCIRFKGVEPYKPYIDFESIQGTIFDLIEESMKFIMRNIQKVIWVSEGKTQREEKYEYPLEAIREAIVNAIVHRDYNSTSKVQIRVFENRIEIWNPGRLPEGLSVDKLKKEHESIPWNPLLFKQLFLVKYVEDVGGGTLDMIKACRNYGLPDPEFEDKITSFVVTFRKYYITDELLEDLTDRQKKIINYLKTYKKISRKECMNILQTSKDTAIREFSYLKNKNIIKRIGKGKNVYYIFA